ncbi:MAG: sugar kinase [Clostridia bacterium]|nr:sugar kinase [Clostridia bacterium]NCC44726.1 sugar kinase [Clostridia bacterium]
MKTPQTKHENNQGKTNESKQSTKKYDLLTFGEVLLRLSPANGKRMMHAECFEQHLGGAELNVAAGAAQLGLKTGMMTKLPENALGLLARNEILVQGVSDEYLVYDDSSEARLGIYYYEGAAAPRKPSVVYDRKNSSINRISPEDFPEEIYRSTRCFHTCGITLALGGEARQTAIAMMKKFKENGAIISFDVNFRGNLWTGAEAKACIEEILPLTDIFFCSEDTARLTFLKEGSGRDMMKEFAKEYPISIIGSTKRTVHSPKKHSFTSTLYDAKTDQYYEEKPYENIEIVDRIGSGDAYIAGALYGILQEPDNLLRAVEYGNAVSAMKNTVPGDLPCMTLDEIKEMIKDHHTDGPILEMKR